MHVVATAGHVDHGKSALVERLTGRHPDRWAEERRRGLTIGLGFAWTALSDGTEIALVDVPGHERFVPTMLSGVGPVPAVLLIVAADEGWRAQSAEHLEALDGLGVGHGLLVVTRTDLAAPDRALGEARAALNGSSLARIGSVAVSSRTGEGFDRLRHELAVLVRALPDADPAADVRLWVDRSFTIAGAGTVVTGTLAAGTVRVGDALVSTGGRTAVVRSLQSLERPVDEAGPVARVALNLRGIARDEVAAGDALLTPSAWRVVAEVDVATGADPAGLRGELVAHIGAAAVAARVRPLGAMTARLRLARPVPLRCGDRLLVRVPGRPGRVVRADVLDVDPPALRRRGAAAARGRLLDPLAGEPAARLAVAKLAGREVLTGRELRVQGLPPPGRPVAGDWYADPRTWERWRDEVGELVVRWRAEHPLDPGVPVGAVGTQLRLPETAATDLVPALAAEAGLAVSGGLVTQVGDPRLPDAVRAAVRELRAELERSPFAAPDAAALRAYGLGRRELAAAARAGELLLVSDQVALRPEAGAEAVRRLAALPQPFTASQARQALDTTRRVALPLLDWLDRHGRTRRLPDDTREVRHPPPR